ncbi:MAG TPA: sigma-70 family RNA polymerase sigma factor [Candidatus Acidoferrales bacterium]|nr:sigma-70 family RNA polymerase sigma factor [Candidatus Acidoferrales bacterium]
MVRSNGHSDDDLVRRLLAGEESAFVLLYRRWQGPIYRFALHMSGNGSIAEDVTQEVFMSLIREGSRFDPELGSISAYLFGIARNQVRKRYDRDRHLVPLPESAVGASEGKPANGNGTHPQLIVAPVDLSRGETIARVREAVLSLPEHYREVAALCDLQEMSYEEAALALNCAVGTVRSRLHRARALLAEKLAERQTPEAKLAAGGVKR